MFVLVKEHSELAAHYVAQFDQEALPLLHLSPNQLEAWMTARMPDELRQVQGFVIGDCQDRIACAHRLHTQIDAPLVALTKTRSLDQTLELFSANFDVVVHAPVHVKEIVVRTSAIRRRSASRLETFCQNRLTVFFDGRDPEIDGKCLLLPRRERDLLCYLAQNRGRQVSKTQVFHALYSDDREATETVVESHVSKLRKKLRLALGFDVIECRRMAGYGFYG
ncbi:winged helix-turn-helix domain-containing protein [Microvirga rosea]|uniref:winged helix-turn-helix domain-containing protein n=1 Tax=Microvirga rosea TaxID=2715425 RepID=UPI001D0AF3CA|nr:winged helix-turn-helix domain-containing protein [Microvirga rosea]MCB8822930.1 winged helix-turn-helix domain-containing protein [Microvirga rosea]